MNLALTKDPMIAEIPTHVLDRIRRKYSQPWGAPGSEAREDHEAIVALVDSVATDRDAHAAEVERLRAEVAERNGEIHRLRVIVNRARRDAANLDAKRIREVCDALGPIPGCAYGSDTWTHAMSRLVNFQAMHEALKAQEESWRKSGLRDRAEVARLTAALSKVLDAIASRSNRVITHGHFDRVIAAARATLTPTKDPNDAR